MSLVLDLLSWICLLGGAFFCITAGLGLLRMPDFYSRSHAGGVMDSLGLGLMVLGMLLQVEHWLVAAKLLMIFIFVFATGPASIHALAHAALLSGHEPLLSDEPQSQTKEGASSIS
ncbi:MAG: monovalent cation/H(+) antiporter subunit G [Nitrospirota bacterium]|jgi:multicomponent Na+:H+ antiporter subunit G